MKVALLRTVAGVYLLLSLSRGLAAEEPGGNNKPCQLETSAFMLFNLLPDPGDFYQLSLGYRLDRRDVLFLGGTTWKYHAPLGIGYGSSVDEYPGYVRAFGLGLGYQRFIWKGLFASVYATPFLQKFYASDDRYLQSGLQLFLQAQLGYQLDVFKGRLFLKPALSFDYWPVNTNLPDAFRQVEGDWPDFVPAELHLNIGFSF
jgi:hypothetical protein